MRENETRLTPSGQWRLFSIFEPAEPNPNRTIDSAVLVWRSATRIMKSGCSDYLNPRTTVQQTFGLATGGPNAMNRAQWSQSNPPGERSRYIFSPDALPRPYDPVALERSLVRDRPGRMTAGEVRQRMEEVSRRPGFRYPTVAEVSEIQRRFYNPELTHAMALARQEFVNRYRYHSSVSSMRLVQNPDGSFEPHVD